MSTWHYVFCEECRQYVNLETANWYQLDASDLETQLGHLTPERARLDLKRACWALRFVGQHNGHRLRLVNEFEFE